MSDDNNNDDDKTTTDEPVVEAEESKDEQSADEDSTSTDEAVAEEPVAPAATSSSEPEAVGTDAQGRQLYRVKCSSCGNDTEVPFKPSGNRPVYCRDCYMKNRQ